jgi:hypothetical protein
VLESSTTVKLLGVVCIKGLQVHFSAFPSQLGIYVTGRSAMSHTVDLDLR